MSRRILPPSQADVLRSFDERLGRLERQKFPESAPQPLPAAGGGGSCTEIIAVSGSKFDHGYLNVEHELVVTERTWAHVTLSGSVTNGTLPGVIELSSPAGQAWAQTFETLMDGWRGSASMTYVEQLDPSPWAQWVGGALFIPSAHSASLLVSIILSPCGEGTHVSAE